jgi:hypothetical protein
MDTTGHTKPHGGMAVDDARYYPSGSQVGPNGQGGIVNLAVTTVIASDDVNDGLVTLSFAGYRDDEPFSYEFDREPEATQLLAQRLMAAADEAGASRTPR